MFPVSTKQSGVTIAFPDVCKIPAPPSPFVPIPYPNVAAALPRESASKVSGASSPVAQKSGGWASSTGNEPGTLKEMAGTMKTVGASLAVPGTPGTAFTLGGGTGLTAAQQSAATQLRAILANVHSQLLAMPGSNPNKWHELVDAYVVAAADLYKVLASR